MLNKKYFIKDLLYSVDNQSKVTGIGFINKKDVYGDNLNISEPHLVMVYVLNGEGELHLPKGRKIKIQTGDVFFRVPNEVHSNYINPQSNWQECYIEYKPEIWQLICKLGFIGPQDRVIHPGLHFDRIEAIYKLYRNFRFKSLSIEPECIHEAIQLCMLSRQPEIISEFVIKACDLLEQNIAGEDDLTEIARTLGMSYSKFRKDFKEKMQISPGQYRIQRRLDLAHKMLLYEDKSIKSVAYELGYSSPFAFSQQFKKFKGFPPKDLKRREKEI
ncbi:MAG: AraC family transcriptional regulator [Lentisphaeria bacterium]|nr:AraC family transcriptional regulator [Lentisphaeria bacterium]